MIPARVTRVTVSAPACHIFVMRAGQRVGLATGGTNDMRLEMTDLGDASRVALEGRLDTPGVTQIETRFTASLVPPGRDAVVDLSAVTFLSSMGIRMLITVGRALKSRNATMVLFGAQPMVRQSLEHVGLPEIITLAETQEQALALLKPA